MDSVLPALLAVTILVLASLMLGRSGFSSFRVLSDSWQDAEERSIERVRSDISITSINVSGSDIDIVVKNDGATAVVDFSRMDMLIQYTNASTTYNKYLDFTTVTAPQPDDSWRVLSISNDVIDPRVLNAGESMTIRARLSPQPGAGSHWLQVTTELGLSADSSFTS